MTDLAWWILGITGYLIAATATAGVMMRRGEDELGGWVIGCLWPFGAAYCLFLACACAVLGICWFPGKFLAICARRLGNHLPPTGEPMSHPEVKFTLVARYETHPGEGGYASATTPQACLDLDREMLEGGEISLLEFIDFIGEFSEVEWAFELVPAETDTVVGFDKFNYRFETPRGH